MNPSEKKTVNCEALEGEEMDPRGVGAESKEKAN